MDIEARMHEVEQEIISRRPEHSVDLALDRMAELVGLLGDPQRACPVIHITGTNGKTSTARMVDTLLRSRGLRTGRFTSPHLVSIRERICIDGAPIAPEQFVAAYEEVLPYVAIVDGRHPVAMSFFEVLTGMAFAVFADTPVDVMVLEVGLGGRLDCTNVADGIVAVVTPIALDHTRLLGSTTEEIAAEKAGIIKPGAVAVLAQQPLEAAEVLLRHAVEVGATVAREGGVRRAEPRAGDQVGGQLVLQMPARQLRARTSSCRCSARTSSAAARALAAVEAFAGVANDGGDAALDADLVREAFANVTSPGRLEVVRRSPTIIIDASHNPAGMSATVAAVQETFSFNYVAGVFAASGDKDVPGMLAELEPLLDQIVVTRNSSDRSMDPAEAAELAAEVFGEDRVQSAARLDDAIDAAVALADEAGEAGEAGVPGGSGVLVTGSVITAGDARRLLVPGGGELPADPSASQPSRHSFTAAELS